MVGATKSELDLEPEGLIVCGLMVALVSASGSGSSSSLETEDELDSGSGSGSGSASGSDSCSDAAVGFGNEPDFEPVEDFSSVSSLVGVFLVVLGVVFGCLEGLTISFTSGSPSCFGGSNTSIFFFSNSVNSCAGILTHLMSSISI